MRLLIAISGPIAVGKSECISWLIDRFGAIRVSTRAIIQGIRDVPSERHLLQEAGEALDRETDGKWVANVLTQRIEEYPDDAVVIVDSVRTAEQVEHLRRAFGDNVRHLHLTASDTVLAQRFAARKTKGDPAVAEFDTYEDARRNSTEAQIETLGSIADHRLCTERLDSGSVATLAAAKWGLFPLSTTPLVDVVVGGQYGSEGKGNICDYLAPEYDVLVRVGGPNAGHRVKEPRYDYVHLPSGTGANPKAQILIGAGATLNVVRLLREIIDLRLDPGRVSIDPQAIVIEQSDRDYEEELGEKIGSTKKGVGVAAARKILGRDGGSHLGGRVRLVRDIPELKPFMRPVSEVLEDAYLAGKRVLLEGTQGTDLSIHHGIYPNVTSRETTASGCLADAGIGPRRVDRIYMVTRTYPIRVGGNSGEMGIEIDVETIASRSGLSRDEIDKTEVGTVSGKRRRIGEFSWDRVRRAAQLNGATDLVLTFADYLSSENRQARDFTQLTAETNEMIDDLERITGVRVTVVSVGFGRDKILDRRQRG